MANHPNRAQRYKVWPVPQASDDLAETYFAVKGPDVSYFTRMGELAKIMQQALNQDPSRQLTAAERDAVVRAIGLVMAGEFDGSVAEFKALERAWQKL